jgi:hypothetical protein
VSDHYQIVAFVGVDEEGLASAARQTLQFLLDRRYRGARIPAEEYPEERLRPWFVAAGLDEAAVEEQLSRARERLTRRVAFVSGDEAAEAVEGGSPPSRSANAAFGIELCLGWEVHGDVNVEYAATCPSCDATTRGLHLWEGSLAQAASTIEEDADAPLPCGRCGAERPLRSWSFDPPLWVAPMALRFGNWGPLTRRFLEELERISGSPARLTRETV